MNRLPIPLLSILLCIFLLPHPIKTADHNDLKINICDLDAQFLTNIKNTTFSTKSITPIKQTLNELSNEEAFLYLNSDVVSDSNVPLSLFFLNHALSELQTFAQDTKKEHYPSWKITDFHQNILLMTQLIFNVDIDTKKPRTISSRETAPKQPITILSQELYSMMNQCISSAKNFEIKEDQLMKSDSLFMAQQNHLHTHCDFYSERTESIQNQYQETIQSIEEIIKAAYELQNAQHSQLG